MSSSEFKLNLAVVIGMNDYQKGISAFIEDANAIAEPPIQHFLTSKKLLPWDLSSWYRSVRSKNDIICLGLECYIS